ncbi:MAG TPA: DUF1499 domain-containing protein [Burkholderiaceae bacterium]|nr:DUF1499 domain-containing protein [Burkholderiaceae bacterium]
MNWLIGIVITLAALVVLAVAAGQLGFLQGKPAADLGVNGGRLKRPSITPNSVTSQADLFADHPMRDYARVTPLPASGGAQASIARLRAVVERWPGATVVEQRDDYLYARFETKLLRFVDDAEFWYDPAAQVIQVRSASRLGRKDFGVNRARIEAIREKLLH